MRATHRISILSSPFLGKHIYCLPVRIIQFRTIVLDVACPDMGMVLYGFVVAFIMLGVGTLAFLKSQDRFILYI